jgi:hypothetical protein
MSGVMGKMDELNAKERQRQMELRKQQSDAIVANLRREMEAGRSAMQAAANIKGPAALERGSQAAFSAFQENKRGADVMDKQLALQKKMEMHLAELKRRGIVLAEAKL